MDGKMTNLISVVVTCYNPEIILNNVYEVFLNKLIEILS